MGEVLTIILAAIFSTVVAIMANDAIERIREEGEGDEENINWAFYSYRTNAPNKRKSG